MASKQLVILDRDGVINEDRKDYVKSPDEWQPLPDSIAAIVRLQQAGFAVAIATNQSGLGRGYFSQASLDAMHEKMQNLVQQAGGEPCYIAYCPHLPTDDCTCRKPKPGLLLQILAHFKKQPAAAWMVGDSLRDLQAATACGVDAVLVKTGNGVATLLKSTELEKQYVVQFDLASAADFIIKQR